MEMRGHGIREKLDPVELTKKLVQIDSTNPGKYEKDAAEYIRELGEKYLPEKGRIEYEEVTEGRPMIMLSLPGKDASLPEFVWICHMDTVPEGEFWTEGAWSGKEKDGKIYGRGSCDMKSGLAASLAAFLNYAAEHLESQRTLKWIGTMDEEADMLGSARALELGWVGKDSLLMDCEPTYGEIQTAHKSRFWFFYTIHGKAAHASEPWTGADAISGMAYAIASIRKQVSELRSDDFLGKSTITFGQIQGGIHPYQVPGECSVSVDMRIVPPYTIEDMAGILRKGAEDAAGEIPGLSCSVEIRGDRPSVPHHEDGELLRRVRAAVKKVTNQEAIVTSFPGYTDTAVVAGRTGNPNTLSYGPGSLEQAHKPDEYVEISEIERCYKVYEEILKAL